jgi:hypothetical protein
MIENKESKMEIELNNLFEGKEPSDIAKVVKKAKRRTILRNIIISLLVIFFLFITLGFTWLYVMRTSEENAIRDIELFGEITNPNVKLLGNNTESNGLIEGILTFNRYKEIEGIPVDWSDNVFTYSLFGGVSGFTGDHSPIQIQDKHDGLVRYYDPETKQRMMDFYHPDVKYSPIRNDLNILNNFTDDALLEMGLSFNQKYTVKEVLENIPKDVTFKWFWVDTYSDADIKWMNKQKNNLPELANKIYGFSENSTNPLNSVENFVYDINLGLNYKDGKYYGEFNRINNNLKGDSAELKAENIKIIGAVVTGTVADLAKLKDKNMIRASVLGVSVKPY